MQYISLSVDKGKCFDEAAKTSAYVATKRPMTNGSYDRVAIKDADRYMLERYWQEATDVITDTLKEYIDKPTNIVVEHGSDLSKNYVLYLKLPDLWDSNMANSIRNSIQSYITNYVLMKWLELVHSEEYKTYAEYNQAIMQEIIDKLYSRINPTRPADL